jgi:hypothetical protein
MPDGPPSRNDTRCPNATRRREALRRKWKKAVAAYETAGRPFGPSTRGVEVWIEYGRQTTAN